MSQTRSTCGLSSRVLIAAAGVCMGVSAASAQTIEVIYTKIPTHPTSVVPGAVDLSGQPEMTRFRALEDLFVSPDGSMWMIKGRTQQGPDLENIMLLGSGTTGTKFLQEGEPMPGGAPGELVDFFGSGVGRFDGLNRFAFSARSRGGVAATAQKVIMWDGTDFIPRYQQGTPLQGLEDQLPNPSGDELFGNSVGSIHLLNDGRIGSHDTTIQNIHSSRRPALFYNTQMHHQINVTRVLGMDGVTEETWLAMDANRFYTTPDGEHWVAQGRVVGMPFGETLLVHNDRIVMRTGFPIDPVQPSVLLNGISNTELARDGTWYSRGNDTTSAAVAVQSGRIVARAGQPITPGATEHWTGSQFTAFTGNGVGDWVLVGTTDNPDPGRDMVVVLNGEQVILREGDQIDLGGGGFPGSAYIGRLNNSLSAFEPNDIVLTDDLTIYVFVNLWDGAADLNSDPPFTSPQAFLRITLGGTCPADWNDDGQVNSQDISAFITSWLDSVQNGTLEADFNGDGFVNSTDISAFITAWLAAVQGGC